MAKKAILRIHEFDYPVSIQLLHRDSPSSNEKKEINEEIKLLRIFYDEKKNTYVILGYCNKL